MVFVVLVEWCKSMTVKLNMLKLYTIVIMMH